MLFVAVTTVNAQSVTKIHENDIMNQFLTMETGAGALTPAAYYNTFHKSYQRDANVRNKLIYRTSVMAAVNEEKAPAEKIDSDYDFNSIKVQLEHQFQMSAYLSSGGVLIFGNIGVLLITRWSQLPVLPLVSGSPLQTNLYLHSSHCM